MNLREIEDAGQRFYERKGAAAGESADPPELEDDDLLGQDDLHPCACRDHFLYGPPYDCPACAGTGFADTPNEWCDACGLSGECPDCDGDAYDRAGDR